MHESNERSRVAPDRSLDDADITTVRAPGRRRVLAAGAGVLAATGIVVAGGRARARPAGAIEAQARGADSDGPVSPYDRAPGKTAAAGYPFTPFDPRRDAWSGRGDQRQAGDVGQPPPRPPPGGWRK